MSVGWLARAAPAAFVLIWSTGFVGARYGLTYTDPFTLLAVRIGLAAVILALLARVFRAGWLTDSRQYGRSALIGVLFHAGYLGGLFYAIYAGLPVSVTALIACLQPVLVAALSGQILGERVTRRQWLGVAMGLLGVTIVLEPGLANFGGADAYPLTALAAAIVALLSTTAATLLQKRYGAGIPLLPGTSVQYFAAAIVLSVLALATEKVDIDWTPQFIAVLAWMVLGLSIGAILLMYWLLRVGTASGVSSLFYLVPPVTLVEAYLLFGEVLPLISLVGFAVSTVGVALVRTPGSRAGRPHVPMGEGPITPGLPLDAIEPP